MFLLSRVFLTSWPSSSRSIGTLRVSIRSPPTPVQNPKRKPYVRDGVIPVNSLPVLQVSHGVKEIAGIWENFCDGHTTHVPSIPTEKINSPLRLPSLHQCSLANGVWPKPCLNLNPFPISVSSDSRGQVISPRCCRMKSHVSGRLSKVFGSGSCCVMHGIAWASLS
jgi:hypothetical protein